MTSNSAQKTSTIFIAISCLFASVYSYSTDDPRQIYSGAAFLMLIGLALSDFIELKVNFNSIFRADLVFIHALYLLLFFEFLFPQDTIPYDVTPTGAQEGVFASIIAFLAFVIGRQLIPINNFGIRSVDVRSINRNQLLFIFLFAAFFGFLHMLLAVRFDVMQMTRELLQPRFTQSWTRGRIGGFDTLINEFALLLYLIPPLGGAILATRKRFNFIELGIVITIFCYTFFYAFAGGTRNVFLAYVIGFAAGWILFKRSSFNLAEFGSMAGLAAASLFVIYYLPEIRTVGLNEFEVQTSRTDSVFVDMNLPVVSRLTQEFPERYEFVGGELLFIAMTKPIPRAIWPSKPIDTSISVSSALSATDNVGTTSASFVGESFMAGGHWHVGLYALFLGMFASVWNKIGAQQQSLLGSITFISGLFFFAVIARSIQTAFPLLLPALFMIVVTKFNQGYIFQKVSKPRFRPHGISR